jgi:hypothetical protein
VRSGRLWKDNGLSRLLRSEAEAEQTGSIARVSITPGQSQQQPKACKIKALEHLKQKSQKSQK